MNPLLQAKDVGQQLWLDNLSRTLLNEGQLASMIAEDGIDGITTNPSIFHKAIADGRYYEDDLARLKTQTMTAEARYEGLVIPDVQRACDLMRPTFDARDGAAGFVSLEVSPELAHDTAATVAAGVRLHQAVARDNLLIKVPATPAGLQAITELIGRGISVNVTLMFSLAHVDAVAKAYLAGLQVLIDQGGDPSRAMSVASLFLSRVDTLVDARLTALGEACEPMQGKTAVAMAKLAYQAYLQRFQGPAFADLAAAGARPQAMLWASTGTKNPNYSDLLYVEPLIGPETVNTLPDATLAAFRDHGKVANTITQDVDAARAQFDRLASVGIDMYEVGEQLQREGLAQFEKAFSELLTLTA